LIPVHHLKLDGIKSAFSISGEDQLHDATEQPNLFEDLLEIEKNAHSSAKCSTEQCHYFGNPAKHGYCNSCYNQLFKRN